MIPELITLYGDDRRGLGFWATAAAAAAKIGVKVGKGIVRKVKSKKKKKKQAAELRRASVVVPVTENELQAVASLPRRIPVAVLGVAAVGLLLLLRGGSK